ncbi:MAG: mannitol-1-phosphate 5-dehydrogenase, partial [Spirochaetia bacterium]|nr:mannitol-1-phosphate 5-dehydrogenase [Spirochaetia bacterium]
MALSFVQWGAGNIGRSFIGSVFNKSGYKVTFIDIDTHLIEALNKASSYVVKTIDGSVTKDIVVQGVSAVNGNNQEEVNNAIIGASLIGVSVGKNVWPHIASSLAKAIISRYKEKPREPLNIILAENIHHASDFVTSLITPHLPDKFPFTTYVGLVETSIGKMVPLQDTHQPLVLKSEVYNELIVDKNGFIGALPEVKDLHPVTPIEAYVDRKLFIHNLGHATTSYVGFSTHPNSPLIATVLEDKEVLTEVREAMIESSEVLLELYPTVFTNIDLLEHIDDLLRRFQNLALGDTLYRV